MDRYDYKELSYPDYVRAMFANTKPDGGLTFRDENETEDETCYLEWTEEEAEAIAKELENLCAALDRLVPEYDRWMESTAGMPEELVEIWNTYLRPYPDHNMDREQLYDISMKLECGEELTEEEQKLHDQECAWMMNNALQRLPYERCNPVNLIQRARRYVRLQTLSAPQLIVDMEAHRLAEELVWYRAALPFG